MSLRKPASQVAIFMPLSWNLQSFWGGGSQGKRKQPKVGRKSEGAHTMCPPEGDSCPAVSSGLGGEEQVGESPVPAVSVHKGQGVLRVMLDHGGHRGEELDKAGRASVGPLGFSLPTTF